MSRVEMPSGRVAGTLPVAAELAGRCGALSPLARRGVPALYHALCRDDDPPAAQALSRWNAGFRRVYGRDGRQTTVGVRSLAKRYRVASRGLQCDALLFALHTYFAALVKQLVEQILGRPRSSAAERTSPAEGADAFPIEPFDWAFHSPCEAVLGWLGSLRATCVDCRPAAVRQHPAADLFKPLYQDLLPRSLRHELGEYYTPDWLAEHVLDQVGYTGDPGMRLLDPTCGSGTFLLAAIRRILARPPSQRGASLWQRVRNGVVGFDLNPLAVLAARANYLIAVADLLGDVDVAQIPVYLGDAILETPGPAAGPAEQFDVVVGNPPWIAWDNLPQDYRQATKPLWERYGLFSLSANRARHGGGKKDLAMLMLYTAADRYLKRGGRLSMVVTQTLFQTRGAGDGFRRLRLGPDGEPLCVLRVDDMVAMRPFRQTANWTSTILLEKGAATHYPVPYVKWLPGAEGGVDRRTYAAEPIDPDRPGSPWFLRPHGFRRELKDLLGPSDYTAHLGANSGGANGVYWLELLGAADGGIRVRNLATRGKLRLGVVEQVVEPDLLYPLLRWADVTRYHARPSGHILVSQDVHARSGIAEEVMHRRWPRTLAYLEQFGPLLRRRAAYRRYQDGGPFYSMYNVGDYTLAPIKVVWRRMDRRLRAAVVEEVADAQLGRRPVVPQETCVLVACTAADEAHYVCAVLNSAVAGFLVEAHSVRGGKGFGTPGVLDHLRLRRFDADDRRHRELAACSRRAHRAVADGSRITQVQDRIDRLAGELWGLDAAELAAMQTVDDEETAG